MGIFRRVSDILNSNLNELVDQFERPEAMLKQAVREMETALSRTMHRAAQVIAAERLLLRRADEQQLLLERWQQRAEQAIDRGDEDAARRALHRKHEQAQTAATLATQISALQTSSRRLRGQVAALRLRLSEANAKLLALLARQSAAEAQRLFARQLGKLPAADDPCGNFTRLTERVEQAEAEAAALAELADAEFTESDEQEQELAIAADLQRLKEQRGRRN